MNHERHEKVIFKGECYEIQGAIFDVYREMGYGLLVNFGTYLKSISYMIGPLTFRVFRG